MEKKEEYIVRKNLTKPGRGKKLIDMPYVYSQLDKGRPLAEIAEELRCSRPTIYRRHREYQNQVDAILKADANLEKKKQAEGGELPPLPEEL